MGYLIYGGKERFEVDDRQLAHVKAAIHSKLRRKECFVLNWPDPGRGRTSVWISPSVPLMFHFSGSRRPSLNSKWVQVMEHMADTPRGLTLITEEEANKLLRERDRSSARSATEPQ
ncbi:DUF7882 family protein [Leucobacter tenebrionis]|uniref:DUF7882 family protein n=1 Tax=Leucobacter tenebrionis TaxID=2873270 RepID=UPI001CA6D9EA|nr:hypothetical protein [Leucobacter tenebrionis]QZY52938.1 hypothetical protein KVY00_05750 [Leucobacter tenebrionis]